MLVECQVAMENKYIVYWKLPTISVKGSVLECMLGYLIEKYDPMSKQIAKNMHKE